MVRKHISLTAEDRRLLKDMARTLDVSESEVVRRGIQLVAEHASRDEAWREEREFVAERLKLPTLPGRRSWTRDELYDRSAPHTTRRRVNPQTSN